MSHQPEFNDSLFIFNDNEEMHNTCTKGIGNAVMRVFNKHSTLEIPKSAGIPTGTLEEGGYTELNEHTKKIIDDAINEIRELIEKYNYKYIFYSVDKNGKLGTSLFEVDLKVIDYIDQQIKSLSTETPIIFG
jgi:phosphoribosyl-dephospho-CoA transferase